MSDILKKLASKGRDRGPSKAPTDFEKMDVLLDTLEHTGLVEIFPCLLRYGCGIKVWTDLGFWFVQLSSSCEDMALFGTGSGPKLEKAYEDAVGGLKDAYFQVLDEHFKHQKPES